MLKNHDSQIKKKFTLMDSSKTAAVIPPCVAMSSNGPSDTLVNRFSEKQGVGGALACNLSISMV